MEAGKMEILHLLLHSPKGQQKLGQAQVRAQEAQLIFHVGVAGT